MILPAYENFDRSAWEEHRREWHLNSSPGVPTCFRLLARQIGLEDHHRM